MGNWRVLAVLVACLTVLFFFGLAVDFELTRALDTYGLALAGLCGFHLLSRIRDVPGPLKLAALDQSLEGSTTKGGRTGDLETIRELVATSRTVGSSRERLAELTREIAADRLWEVHGIDLAREPGRAQDVLPADVWQVVRADRPMREAVDPALLRTLVETFERMGPRQ